MLRMTVLSSSETAHRRATRSSCSLLRTSFLVSCVVNSLDVCTAIDDEIQRVRYHSSVCMRRWSTMSMNSSSDLFKSGMVCSRALSTLASATGQSVDRFVSTQTATLWTFAADGWVTERNNVFCVFLQNSNAAFEWKDAVFVLPYYALVRWGAKFISFGWPISE